MISPADLDALIGRIPRLFHLLKALGDSLHADLGVTTAMRGVMNSLAAQGPRTVPELARERPVSRQHIQTVVDDLFRAGLAHSRPNPAHRRSVLIALTAAGEAMVRKIRQREAAVFSGAAPDVARADLAAAFAVLDALENRLAVAVDLIKEPADAPA